MEAKLIQREIADFVFEDQWLGGSMLFMAGPRQCGKTSLARAFLEARDCGGLYFNWDIEKIRRQYRRDPDFMAKAASALGRPKPWIVLDEIHKLTRWKNILKGLYDEYGDRLRIIVTGSARLDLFRRSGDSLVGRYTLANLFPFSLREWAGNKSLPRSWLHEKKDWDDPATRFETKLLNTPTIQRESAQAYFELGPFPSPLISGSMQRSRKWHRDYITLLVREDLRDLSGIQELDRVAHLVELLPSRIGSPISLRSLGEDLAANHTTVKNWLQALARLYLLWPLRPFAGRVQRTLRKEPKWYFLDWTYAAQPEGRFENMLASGLYRFVVSLRDRGWPDVRLHYMRTYDKKEIDFILVSGNAPILAVEAKLGATNLSPQLRKFAQKWSRKIPVVQVINQPGVLLRKGALEYIVGFDRLLAII